MPPATPADPHAGQTVLAAGPALDKAAAALVLVHGRGASAAGMLPLLDDLAVPGLAALAPQAAGHTWYPYSFLAPLAANAPYLESALAAVDAVVTGLLARGLPSTRIALLGFSQGACLTAEYVARHPRRYGAVLPLVGGLIGPPGTPRDYPGSLAGTPILLSSPDPDPHVPFPRVQESADTFTRMGAAVDLRRYPGGGHTINSDQLTACQKLLQQLVSDASR
jgi:predicted esterase